MIGKGCTGKRQAVFPELSGQAFKVRQYVLLRDLLAVRLFMPALGLLPWGGRGGVDASELLGRIFAIDVPDMLQKGDNVRFLLQRGLAAAGMLYGRVGRLILVFMINGRKYRTGRPGFHPFIDQESASPVQMPPVRQNDQMVQFDGRQDEPLGVRLLNEPVAEFCVVVEFAMLKWVASIIKGRRYFSTLNPLAVPALWRSA